MCLQELSISSLLDEWMHLLILLDSPDSTSLTEPTSKQSPTMTIILTSTSPATHLMDFVLRVDSLDTSSRFSTTLTWVPLSLEAWVTQTESLTLYGLTLLTCSWVSGLTLWLSSTLQEPFFCRRNWLQSTQAMNSESTPTPPLAFTSAQMHLKLLWDSSAFLISHMSTNCSSMELCLMLWPLAILITSRPWSEEICSSVFMEGIYSNWDYLFHSTWLPELWILMCLLTLEVLTRWLILN